MKKEDIEKILKEADDKLRNYSDAQHRGQSTINKNRTKESCSSGGKIGGPKGGKIAKDNKLGFHSMKKEDRVKELEKQYIEPILENKNLSNHERVKQKLKAKFKVDEIIQKEFPGDKK